MQPSLTASLSVGGATDSLDHAGGVIEAGKGAEYAEIAANFVLQYGLDGLDFDLELEAGNSAPFKNGKMQTFMTEALVKARQLLPKPYVISHAPMGPYASTWAGSGSGYVNWMLENQDDVDFISLQYYNQGAQAYNNYQKIFKDSSYPGSSVQELIQAGVKAEKIVVGKPLTTQDASNGYIAAGTLASWGCQANSEVGFVGGYMTWMFKNDDVSSSANWGSALNTLCDGAEVPANRCQ